MKQGFSFFQNPFQNAVNSSFRKALTISYHHDTYLSGRSSDPFFGPMYTYYHPFHAALKGEYVKWIASGGAHKGATNEWKLLISQLSPTKINEWDTQIMTVYPKRSTGHIAIFPKGHKPFQTGSKLSRVNAVRALSKSLNGIVSLAATKTNVDDFLLQLDTVLGVQEGKFLNTDDGSAAVKQAVNAAMLAMFIDFASCLQQFPTSPNKYEMLFDLDTIRQKKQKLFTGGIAKGKTKILAKRTLKPGDKVWINNPGKEEINVCLLPSKIYPATGGVIIQPGEEKEVDVESLGDITKNKFLAVYNTGMSEGSFEIKLL